MWDEVVLRAKNIVENILYNSDCKSYYEKNIRILFNDAFIEKAINGKKDAEYQYTLLSKFTELYFDNLISKMIPEFLIYSLSRNYNVGLMWSHYANEHKGICLEYNIDNKLDTFIKGDDCKQCYIRNVIYDESCSSFNFFTDNIMFLIDDMRKDYHHYNKNNVTKFYSKYDEKNFTKRLKTLYIDKLTTKTKDWSYEKETRILFQEKDISNHINGKQFSYKYNSLKSITFGLKTTMEDIIYICKCFKFAEKKIPIFYKCCYKYNSKVGKFSLKRYRIRKEIVNGFLNK